ncbi:MAG: hypothetical protein AB7P03_18160 [Kofleriaceae bacterium]
MKRVAAAAAALLCWCACNRRPAIESCRDSLAGVWRSDAGETWMIREPADRTRPLEIYPLFKDLPDAQAEIEMAPRLIELSRSSAGIAGHVRRRYMHHGVSCTAAVSAAIVRCAGNELDVELAEPVAPTSFAPCTWPGMPSIRRERWRRD